ncbi:MAG: hypothetical protein Q9226_002538 [Calogaya cf. arnoldii]
MELDLDAWFGGQGATDLDDYDDETTTVEVDTTIAQPTNGIDLDAFFDGQGATDLDDEDDDTTTAEIDTTIDQCAHIYGQQLWTHALLLANRDGNEPYLIINAPGYKPPGLGLYMRDEAGNHIRAEWPFYRPSPLRQVECAYEDVEVSMTPIDTTSDDDASSSCSAPSDIDADTPPSSPELSPVTGSSPFSFSSPPIDTSPPDTITKPSEPSECRSGMYAAAIFGISVVLALW